jgi:hypothetical protein
MRQLGRLLQWVGLVVPPVSILLQLNEVISLGQMLTMLAAAVCAFLIGRLLEGYAPS